MQNLIRNKKEWTTIGATTWMNLKCVKKLDSKGHTLYDFILITFWESQSYRDKKKQEWLPGA